MPNLIETLAIELERPRELTPQVVRHIIGTYEVEEDAIGSFLEDKLPALEEHEHDLILSPLFTPKLAGQAAFADLLGSTAVPQKDWSALVQDLEKRPTIAHLITSDGKTHRVPLRAVSIERFVYRLRLDGTISDAVLPLIVQAPAADQPMLKAIARRATWENEGRRDIFIRYLQTSLSEKTYAVSEAVEVLRLAEDYHPQDSAALLARIPKWVGTLEEEINAAESPKPFFSRAVQELHGGNDQRQRDDTRIAAKRNELAFLQRLQVLLANESN